MHENLPPDFPPPVKRPRREAGFSLAEVAMAIGIIAVAFVALFALLPVGLNGFRASMDTANETWIMQGINSMVQTTPWENIYNPGGQSQIEKDVYYYDEEGRLIETQLKPDLADPEKALLSRIYQVKLLVDPAYRFGVGAKEAITTSPTGDSGLSAAVRIVAVIANATNPSGVKAFEKIKDLNDVIALEPGVPLTVRSFVMTQMNSSVR